MAIDRYKNGEPFTNQEVEANLNCLRASFGETEASGFLNLVMQTIKENKKLVDNFGLAVVTAIGKQA